MTFLQNKDPGYGREQVDCKLSSGHVIKIQAHHGGWMGATQERPYPDFEEVGSGGRIERNDLYMEIARLYAQRSTCVRGQVGCVAVLNNHIIAAGYNGAPPGMDHCLDVGCGGGTKRFRLTGGSIASESAEHLLDPNAIEEVLEEFPNGCTRAIHAELNMVARAAKIGVSLDGATVYATAGPCLPCAQALISSGMGVLFYEVPYRLPQGLELVDKAHIPIRQLGVDDA